MAIASKKATLNCGVALTALIWSTGAFAQTKTFNIPSEDAVKAIPEFARQAGVQIVAPGDQLKGVKTPRVEGALDLHVALRQLLAGTDIEIASDDGLTIVLRGRSKNVEAASNEAAASDVETITVTAHYQFLSADTRGATNLPIPIEKVPQSISLVSGDFIKAADLKTLSEIAEYTPGAINAGNQDNLGSDIKLRGFTAGRAVDGINLISSFNYYEADYAIYDRLEVVKGPSSVVYGVSSPGGVVNFVTKSATVDTPSYLAAQVGSWDGYRVEGQLAGSLDADNRVRAIAVVAQEGADSFIHGLHHTKTVLYGGLNFDITDTLSGYIHGGYERFSRTSFDGTPTEADGTPAPLPKSFFIGSPNIVQTTSAYHSEAALVWDPNELLDVSLKGNFERTDTTGSGSYGFGLQSNGDISIAAQKLLHSGAENYGLGAFAVYKLDGLGLSDSFVSAGALYQSSLQPTNILINAGATNIFAGQAAVSSAFDAILTGPLFPVAQKIRTTTTTFSAQSVIKVLDPVSLLLGISYSKPDVKEGSGAGLQDFKFSGQTSYRAGIDYEFIPGANAYLSYSQSFTPQPLLTVTKSVLPPLTGEQYEGGIKYRSDDGKLLLTAAVYQILERNLGEYDQTVAGTDYFKALGEVKHRGAELQAIGKITDQWQINAGYSYLDPQITHDADPAAVGQTELYLPKNTFSLFTTYEFQGDALDGVTIGGGIRHVANERTSYDGSTKDIPSYTLVDATVSYHLDKWLLQFSAHNIFNKRYYINNYQTLFYGNVIGDPANVSFSIRREF